MNHLKETIWIQTYNGIKFYPFAPKAKDIYLDDIAWQLSMNTRYAGACRKYYSVAEHAVLITRYIIKYYEDRLSMKDEFINCCLMALHHDDAEFLLRDVPTPIKSEDTKEIEKTILNSIWNRFEIKFDSYSYDLVKFIDKHIMIDEKKQVLKHELEWESLKGLFGLGIKVKFWNQRKAYREYLKLHMKLINMRNKEYLNNV